VQTVSVRVYLRRLTVSELRFAGIRTFFRRRFSPDFRPWLPLLKRKKLAVDINLAQRCLRVGSISGYGGVEGRAGSGQDF